MNDGSHLYHTIKRLVLHWRHPRLKRVLNKIEKGRMRPQQARRWRKRIEPWIEEQERCFNPLPQAPDQTRLGKVDIELGELIENEGVYIGPKILQPGKHVLASGATGAGKSTVLRRLVDELNRINRNALTLHNHPDI